MRIARLLGAMFLSFFLLGCISGSHQYDAPGNIPPIKNSITLNQSKEATWKQLIAGLSKSFFVINNVDKDSGLINVSFSGSPEDFIDCGTLHFTVTNARGTRNYNFPAASQDKKYEVVERGHLYFLHRQLALEGRMNYPAASSGVSRGKDLSAASGGVLTPVLRNKHRGGGSRRKPILSNRQHKIRSFI